MKGGRREIILLGVLGCALLFGFITLFRMRVSQGDIFPAYSSLRADPLGTRGLHDALAALPGMRVERRFEPIQSLRTESPRTIVMAGFESDEWRSFPSEDFAALDGAIRGGSRLVLGMRAEASPSGIVVPKADGPGEAEPKIRGRSEPKGQGGSGSKGQGESGSKGQGEPGPKAPEPAAGRRILPEPGDYGNPADRFVDVSKLWGIDVVKQRLTGRKTGAVLDPDAASRRPDLPLWLGWRSDITFVTARGTDWHVLYRVLDHPVAVEMRYGLGSIVLLGDSYPLSNEALAGERPTPLLTALVGPNRLVEFDESHLGVVQDQGVASLARRYGLGAAYGLLLLLAALHVWRRTALFVPPAAERDSGALACSATAALGSLLVRAVPRSELLPACAAEWRRTAQPRDLARLQAALASARPLPAAAAYNSVVRALRAPKKS